MDTRFVLGAFPSAVNQRQVDTELSAQLRASRLHFSSDRLAYLTKQQSASMFIFHFALVKAGFFI
jgi:hypothetical protein